MTAVVVGLLVILLLVVTVFVCGLLMATPSTACQLCNAPTSRGREYCDACLGDRLRDDVQDYLTRRVKAPVLFDSLVQRLEASEGQKEAGARVARRPPAPRG